ncbi:MAG: galactose mutarotase [Planctomycetes bacterium]|nr:galactose mutarotase [Planctomycetota bacterium]
MHLRKSCPPATALLLALASCSSLQPGVPFGPEGEAASRYELVNAAGMRAVFTDLGATLVSLEVPSPAGPVDLVLGFDDAAGYRGEGNQYFGCTVGRVANRIGNSRFLLGGSDEAAVDGAWVLVDANDGPHSLHGGPDGAHLKLWEASGGGQTLRFRRLFPDGEGGYPGNLQVEVAYTLTDDNALEIQYEATTDATTVVNLTHHSYFNLAAAGAPTVLDHVLTLDAERYTVAGEGLIPTGEIALVEGSPLDFREPQALGARIAALDGTPAIGYDHNFVLRGGEGPAARLVHPDSGRWLEVFTSEPGLQLYSGNFLFGQEGKDGQVYRHRSAVCLETQHFPDAPNHPEFPSIRLEPGETYRSTCVYAFGGF